MFKSVIPVSTRVFSGIRTFSNTVPLLKTNTSTHTKANVHDLETFLTLIGRNSIEHAEVFENDLQKFLKTKGPEMKKLGIDVQARRYLLRWINKFENDLEPLREHVKGKKKNGGERKQKELKAKQRALKRIEDREKLKSEHENDETLF